MMKRVLSRSSRFTVMSVQGCALHRARRAVLACVVMGAQVVHATEIAPQAEPLERQLAVGESQVLSLGRVARVAVGNGDVLHAVVIEDDQVVISGRAEGTSSLHVWTDQAQLAHYAVSVVASGVLKMREDLQALLQSVPRAKTRVVGENIVVEGDFLSDSDRLRIQGLAQRYPQIVDFTSTVGWEQMVMLDVQVVEIPRARMQELGIRWNGSTGGINLGVSWGASATDQATASAGQAPPAGSAATRRVSGHASLNTAISSRINALAEAGDALILAQPQLLARSGATADFLAGGEVPYASVDKDGKTTTLFKPYGVALKMTPYVERNGIVRAHISVEASSVDTAVSATGGPALKTRRATTEFNVRSGRTLVLAGFLSHERNNKRDGLPGLMDIPFVGGLFGVQRTDLRDTELAIFVTPTIVSDDHPALNTRVLKAEQLIERSRVDPIRMNVPMRGGATLSSLETPTRYSSDAFPNTLNDTFSGPGSQWTTP